MASIRPSLEPRDYVIVFGKKVNDFPFSLIAPLQAQNYIYHNSHLSYSSQVSHNCVLTIWLTGLADFKTPAKIIIE
jgi:hypothetical protein